MPVLVYLPNDVPKAVNTKYTDDDNFNEPIEKFNYINSKGYIKGINNNANSCGLTFEKIYFDKR